MYIHIRIPQYIHNRSFIITTQQKSTLAIANIIYNQAHNLLYAVNQAHYSTPYSAIIYAHVHAYMYVHCRYVDDSVKMQGNIMGFSRTSSEVSWYLSSI